MWHWSQTWESDDALWRTHWRKASKERKMILYKWFLLPFTFLIKVGRCVFVLTKFVCAEVSGFIILGFKLDLKLASFKSSSSKLGVWISHLNALHCTLPPFKLPPEGLKHAQLLDICKICWREFLPPNKYLETLQLKRWPPPTHVWGIRIFGAFCIFLT